jgi:hypothetical protein
MKLRTTFVSVVLSGALAITAISPAFAFDQGKGKNKGKGKSSKAWPQKHWNPAPPKKNYRHDNRDWNKSQKVWRRFDDGTRYQYDGRYYYYDNARFTSLDALSARRQQTKNTWRNIAIAGGLLAVIGALQKDNRLVFAGALGGLYALWRYEQDRKSQSQIDRARAYYFSRPYFYRDGHRYERRLVTMNGTRYYRFARVS